MSLRRGKCDKCGAEAVHAARNGINVGSSHDTGFRPHIEPGFRGMLVTHQGEAWQYVCTSCGYMEWHVLDPGTIEFVKRSWGSVRPH